MIRLLASLIFAFALTGCGEVVVFGHTVRENPKKVDAAASQPATDAVAAEPPAPKPATESAVPAAVAPKPAAEAAPDLHTPDFLHAVHVTLSPASQAGDASVDVAALLEAIRTELNSRNLLDEQSPSGGGTAEVVIESVSKHRTVNAVLFGQQPMAGTLTGELHVNGARGERPAARIVAESRFSLAADDENKNALEPLYRRFAVLTADEIAGIAAN